MNHRHLLLNWILAGSYSCIILFAFYSSAYSWPTQGSVIWFLLIIFCPPLLYQGVFIGYVLAFNKKPHWKKSYRLMSLIGGIFIAGGLLQMTQAISFARFKTAYAPMLQQIQANLPQPCQANYFAIPKVNAYHHSVTQKLLRNGNPVAELFYNRQRFVVKLRGGSVDIVGSTLFYDSQTAQWLFFHNSDSASQQHFTERTQGLMQCKNL